MAQAVQVNYDEMNTIIRSMKSEQAQLAQLLNQTRNHVESLHGGGWVGEAADKFYNEMEQTVLPALGRAGQALTTAADIAQKITDTIRQTDEGTKSLFSNLG